MRLLVCGGRDFNDCQKLIKCLDYLKENWGLELIIEGGAKGADAHAATWANNNGIPKVTMTAAWEFHGKKAGPIRNSNMIRLLSPDYVVAFQGGAGTKNMCQLAKKHKICVWETWLS